MCQNLKDAMENEECECDSAPEAFTSDTFCDDKADAYHEKYKKDPFRQRWLAHAPWAAMAAASTTK